MGKVLWRNLNKISFMTHLHRNIYLYYCINNFVYNSGPVWIAIIARTISGGAKSGLSLVSGVCLGDMLWPIIVFRYRIFAIYLC